jgi:hypothetical protein
MTRTTTGTMISVMNGSPTGTTTRTATALVLIAAALLTPIGLAILGHKPAPPGQQQLYPDKSSTRSRHLPSGSPVNDGGSHGGQGAAHDVIIGLLALIAAITVGLLVYLLIRLLSGRRFARDTTLTIEFDPLAAELEDLTDAVAAGTEALEYEGDAREAVIACYAAMEQAVSAGGSGRLSTDTPEEFLRRVTVANLIPEGPAARLTELFREARFSRHPISEAKRDEARDALREISDHVQARAAELAAAKAAAAAELAAARAAAATPAAGRVR